MKSVEEGLSSRCVLFLYVCTVCMYGMNFSYHTSALRVVFTTINVPSHFIGYDETPWYKDDLFGLKTLDLEKGNLYFNTTEGDHLEFTTDYLLDLVGLYFK